MSRTLNTQVALYLVPEKVEQLRQTAKRTSRTQQDLLREGLDLILHKYRRHGVRKGKQP
jgi:hypothetical protein